MKREEIVEQLYRVHGARLVRRLTRMLGQPALAKDVAQDTYERLLRWDQLEKASPRAYKTILFRFAYRLVIDQVRQSQTVERGEVTLAAEHTYQPFEPLAEPERGVWADQAITHLAQFVDSLPKSLREPWILRCLHGLDHPDICARLGITATALEERLRGARMLCREHMANVGFEHF
jgi:RNA polymerase sigma factor (sigma-70 family)